MHFLPRALRRLSSCVLTIVLLVVQSQTGFAIIGGKGKRKDASSSTAGFANGVDEFDFDVHFSRKKELGIIFSSKLMVQGFYRGKRNKELPAESCGLIQTGDTLISVNDIAVTSRKRLKRAIRKVTLPLVMRFRPDTNAKDFKARVGKTCQDFRFNVTFYTPDPPGIEYMAEELTVVKSFVEGVTPGDKLVALNGESLEGATFANAMDKMNKAFTKEVLRCTPTHCHIAKAASFYEYKVLTFEPALVQPRDSFIVREPKETVSGADGYTPEDPNGPLHAVPVKQTATLELLTGEMGVDGKAEVVYRTDVETVRMGEGAADLPCGQFVLASLPADGVDGGGCKSIGHILDETFVMVRHGTCSAADKALNVQYAGGLAIFLPDQPFEGEQVVSNQASQSKLRQIHIPVLNIENEAVELLEKVVSVAGSGPLAPLVRLTHIRCPAN